LPFSSRSLQFRQENPDRIKDNLREKPICSSLEFTQIKVNGECVLGDHWISVTNALVNPWHHWTSTPLLANQPQSVPHCSLSHVRFAAVPERSSGCTAYPLTVFAALHSRRFLEAIFTQASSQQWLFHRSCGRTLATGSRVVASSQSALCVAVSTIPLMQNSLFWNPKESKPYSQVWVLQLLSG
jgi:hypothetical protein